jgi:hypothetical protein
MPTVAAEVSAILLTAERWEMHLPLCVCVRACVRVCFGLGRRHSYHVMQVSYVKNWTKFCIYKLDSHVQKVSLLRKTIEDYKLSSFKLFECAELTLRTV